MQIINGYALRQLRQYAKHLYGSRCRANLLDRCFHSLIGCNFSAPHRIDKNGLTCFRPPSFGHAGYFNDLFYEPALRVD